MREAGIAYFAASCDDPETNRRFAESLKLDYPILSDPGGKVARAYGIYNDRGGYPRRVTFYIDKNGRIAAIQRKVNVRNHGAEILEQVKKIQKKASQ